MTDIATLSVKVTTSGIQAASNELDKLGRTAATTETKTSKLSGTIKKASSAFRGLSGALTALGIGAAARQIAQFTDRYASMQGQLKLVTSSQEELNAVYQKALTLANQTGQSVESTVNLYARMKRATAELNLSQNDLFRVTETLNKSFVVSGASADEASRAIVQLSQGLAGGILRAEEYNSVNEQAPYIMENLAKSLGKTRGELRQMVVDGEITTEIITKSMLKMSETVDKAYSKMPMTIGRVMQEIKNEWLDAIGSMDTGPAIDSMMALRDTLKDPEIKSALQSIAAGIVDVVNTFIEIVTWSAKAATSVGEFVAKLLGFSGGANSIQGLVDEYNELYDIIEGKRGNRRAENSPGFKKQLADLKKLKATLEITGNTLVMVDGKWQLLDATLAEITVTAKKWGEGAAKVTGEAADASGEAAKKAKEHAKTLKEVTKFLKPYKKLMDGISKTITDGLDAYDEQIDKTEEYIRELEFEVSLLGKSEDAQKLLRIEREASAMATGELKDKIVALNTELYESDKATKAAAEAQKPFQDALEGTIERIDSAFSDAWRGAFNSFSDFADGIKNSFKNLLAELAHIAITRPIIMSIGGAMGLGTSTAASAASLGGGGIGGILSSVGNIGAGMYSNIGDALTYIGADRLAEQSYMTGMTATPGSLAMSAGAGLLGGFAGNAVFGGGGYSNIGATIGGLGGSIFGPIGAGVGSFLGSGLGSLFGGDNNGDNKGRASINLATGESNVFGVGKSFNQANVDALNSLVPFLQNLADSLGGSSANLDISMGNNSGLSLNGQKFGKDEAGFIAAAIEAMVDGAKTLSPLLKTLIKGFNGTSEELANFAVSMVGITELIAENPVDKAFKDFADAQQAAGVRLTQVYDKQIKELDKLIYGFDGSAKAAVDLNQALAQNKQLAYEMAVAIKSIGDSVTAQVSDQLRYFFDQTRTDDEKLVAYEAQFERLFERLPQLTDPGDIQKVSDRLLWLNKTIFDMGPPDLQRSNVSVYANSARAIDEMTATVLEKAGQTLQTSQQDLNAQVSAMLQVSAEAFQAPADTMQDAANLMYQAVQNMTGNRYSEVVA